MTPRFAGGVRRDQLAAMLDGLLEVSRALGATLGVTAVPPPRPWHGARPATGGVTDRRAVARRIRQVLAGLEGSRAGLVRALEVNRRSAAALEELD